MFVCLTHEFILIYIRSEFVLLIPILLINGSIWSTTTGIGVEFLENVFI